jgi:hypothetical protein
MALSAAELSALASAAEAGVRTPLSAADVARYHAKAAIVLEAWRAELEEEPTSHGLILAMAVAEFETRMGDARDHLFAGEHNWGALHARALTGEEASILLGHGIAPTDDDSLRAARGLLPGRAGEALHIDHHPRLGPYFVWFRTFQNDTEAARAFLRVLVLQRPSVHAIIGEATADELAHALYATRYFEGFSPDAEKEIGDYARNIAARAGPIAAALGATVVPPPAKPPESFATSVLPWIGLALGIYGLVRR